MSMTSKIRRSVYSVGLLSAVVAISGCGKKKSSSNETPAEGASITISGQLILSNSSTASALALAALNATSDISFTDLKVYCVSFSSPPKAGTGSVDAEGKFSLSIDANGVAIGCFVLKGSETVASMTFEDSNSKDVNGEAKSDARLAFSGNTNMGSISLDTATGKAKASVANFKNSVKSFSGAGFDFTGSYVLKAASNLPEGYQTACPAGTPENECRGPMDGMPIYMHRIAGKTVDGNRDAYALAVWKSKTAFENCGKKLGFKIDEAKTKVGIDFTTSGLGDGPLVWESGWDKGWKYVGAETSRPLMMCSQTKLNNVELMKCEGKVNGETAYQVNVNSKDSGCRYDDGSMAKIENWEEVVWQQGGHTCTPFSAVTGLNSCTSKATYSNKTITCNHIGGILMSNNLPPESGGSISFIPTQPYTGLCNNAGTEIQQLQCYADYYFSNAHDRNDDKCIADVQLNWGAQNASEFVMRSDGPARSTNQFVMNLLNYTSEKTAAVRDEKTYFRGFPTEDANGNNSFVNCKVIESTNMAITKISDAEMQVELVMSEKSVDQNPQCGAQFGGELGKVQKMLFKAVKQ